MDADEALMRAWSLGMDEDGWSDAVMDEAERLLPVLVEARYAETDGWTWNFTQAGVQRAMEIERGAGSRELDLRPRRPRR